MTALDRLAAAGAVRRGVPLAGLTTYRLGGAARWFLETSDPERLAEVTAAWREDRVPLLVLGRGSNLVVGEGGFPGLVVRPSFSGVVHRPDGVEAGAGVSLPRLARSAVAEGRLGLEFFVGIPGSVGGAVHQNAGCHGSETGDRLVHAVVWAFDTGSEEVWDTGRLGLRYRHSELACHHLVTSAVFTFEPGPREKGEREMREVVRWRKEHQPGGTLNAGSVFKNPPGDAAGRIIDHLGLKGLRVGGARVSEKHANFFVAERGATPSDVRALVGRVASIVADVTGIRLEPEIQFVGRFEEGRG